MVISVLALKKLSNNLFGPSNFFVYLFLIWSRNIIKSCSDGKSLQFRTISFIPILSLPFFPFYLTPNIAKARGFTTHLDKKTLHKSLPCIILDAPQI